jgi:hypothetical protein
MPKPLVFCALCILSAAVGAAVESYVRAAIERGGPHLVRAVAPKAANAATEDTNVEVLGDRVRCDVRYTELKIPPSEYQSFKRKCMGDKYSNDD